MNHQLPADAVLSPSRKSTNDYLSTLASSRRYSMPLKFLTQDLTVSSGKQCAFSTIALNHPSIHLISGVFWKMPTSCRVHTDSHNYHTDPSDEPIVTAANSRAFFQRKSITSMSFPKQKPLENTDSIEEPIVTASNSRAFFQRKSITSMSFPKQKPLEQSTKDYSRKSKWGYSPYSSTDSAKGAPDSSYKLGEISTSGKNRRSSQPISSLQRLFYSKMNSCPSLSSGDSKTGSAGTDGDDNMSMDSFEGSKDTVTNRDSVKSQEPTDDANMVIPVLQITPFDEEESDKAELLRVEESEEGAWSGFNLILQNGLEAALGQGLTTSARGAQATSKVTMRDFKVKTSFTSKPASFCLNGSTYPPELSAPNTPVTEAFSHFFSAPSFSYPATPVHSAKCSHTRKQKVLTPRSQKTMPSRSLVPMISQETIQGAFADDSIESTQFIDSISQKSYYRSDQCSTPAYFSMVDSYGARRTVREIVRTWGLKLLRA